MKFEIIFFYSLLSVISTRDWPLLVTYSNFTLHLVDLHVKLNEKVIIQLASRQGDFNFNYCATEKLLRNIFDFRKYMGP